MKFLKLLFMHVIRIIKSDWLGVILFVIFLIALNTYAIITHYIPQVREVQIRKENMNQSDYKSNSCPNIHLSDTVETP